MRYGAMLSARSGAIAAWCHECLVWSMVYQVMPSATLPWAKVSWCQLWCRLCSGAPPPPRPLVPLSGASFTLSSMALSLPPESPPAPRVMTVGAPATRRCRRTGALLQRSSSIFTPTSDWSWLHKALHKPVQNCSSALSESDRMIYIACRKNNNCFFATNYVKYHQRWCCNTSFIL